MDSDALEIIEDIKYIVDNYDPRKTSFTLEDEITMYLENKMLEFVPASGDCCG